MKLSLLVVTAALIHSSAALAWSRPGHMVTAAIAYQELNSQQRDVLDKIVALAERHPDRGAFEVAIGRTTGDERAKRIFLELARWPDDTRGSIHDHPTWHYSSRPLISTASPPPQSPQDVPQGAATEAFALNLKVASDPRASAAERAVALCWVFHLVGDMHQPLHSVSQVSKRFPNADGDRGGGLQYVRDPQTNEPVTLHWYWDDVVSRDGEPDQAVRRAEELMSRLPRARFKELKPFQSAAEFSAWAQESHQLAATLAYGPDLSAGDSAASATKLSPRYVEQSSAVAEQRLTLAGYRLTEVLRRAFGSTSQ
jgi:hypothetical protein